MSKLKEMLTNSSERDRAMFRKVKEIIDIWDPLEILCWGGLADEYDHEAWDILQALKDGIDEDR